MKSKTNINEIALLLNPNSRRRQYEEQMRKTESAYPQFRYGVPFMAKESGVAIESESSGKTLNIPWEEVIHKHVRTTDNIDIGDVETVGNEFHCS